MMNLSTDELLSLLWTQCWQLTLVIVVVALLVRFTCRRRPHLAYVLWMVVLLKAVTPPLWSSPAGVFSRLVPEQPVVANVEPLLESATTIDSDPAVKPAAPPSIDEDVAAMTKPAPLEEPAADDQAFVPNAPSVNLADAGDVSANPASESTAERTTESAIATATAPDTASSSWASAATVVVLVWLTGMLVYAAYTILTVVTCWRVVRKHEVPVPPSLLELKTRLTRRLGLSQSVRLLVVDGQVGPLTLGWIRPAVVIPQALLESQTTDELEPVLAHELTHVRRCDGLVGLLQVLVQGIWWFHPLVWLTNRHVCDERERCCDEEVISEMGYKPRRYGRSLLGTLELQMQMKLSPAIPGIRSFEVTRRRLDYLLTNTSRFRQRMPRRYWLVLGLALVLVVPGAGLTASSDPNAAVAALPSDNPSETTAAAATDFQTAETPAPTPESESTPAPAKGWSLTGRVVDPRGDAVADAEVLLLGPPERILVDGNRRTWFDVQAPRGQRKSLPSTRTNENGEFSIERTDQVIDRVAVIATDPILWVVARDSIEAADDAEIKLPPSGSLAIDCDLPGKPAKQGVHIQLATVDGKNWEGDVLRFHMADTFAANPGETVFDHLPPGRYSVERNQQIKTGRRTRLMSLADRQIVDVQSSERATVQFDRSIGAPLTGQVRGLEDADLRHAHVTISYLGPEEAPNKNGVPTRRSTVFDVIPITSDGGFVTDPIPPGDYSVTVAAFKSTTSNQSGAQYDFYGGKEFTVDADDETPTVEFTAKPQKNPDKPNAEQKPALRVVDDKGQPIPRFELKVWTASRGSSRWYIGSKGRIAQNQPLWGNGDAAALDVTVRADGYASTIQRFSGAEREKLLRGEVTMVMDRGQPVQVRLRLPEGVTWPAEVTPELYFDELKHGIRRSWQLATRPDYEKPDTNVLNARVEQPGVATLLLSPDTPPFRVAINAPGFLRFFERGPFTLQDVKDNQLVIDVDAAATLNVRFDPGSTAAAELPFASATTSVLWKLPGTSDSYIPVIRSADAALQKSLNITDLAAGDYHVSIRTTAKPDVETIPNGQRKRPLNPGVFSDRRRIELQAGETRHIIQRYTPFDADAFRGDCSATVQVLKSDGTPATGRDVAITYSDGHYGGLEVFAGRLPESGRIELTNITDRKMSTEVDAYAVTFNGRLIGRFSFATDEETPEFTFFIPPAVGDVAPDVDLLNLATGSPTKLSSLRGKVVCVEFWASWCGPCREPLKKLNELAANQREDWDGQVAIIPLSIDDSTDLAQEVVARRGLIDMDSYWSGSADAIGTDSPAARAFVVSGVPTALIIDREGRIVWRGHPSDESDGSNLADRINAALVN